MSAQLSTLARLTASALSATVAGRNVQKCSCLGCGCREPATTVDNTPARMPVCAWCATAEVDVDGTTVCEGPYYLIDADTNRRIGQATPEQVDASHAEPSGTGIIAIDPRTGDVIDHRDGQCGEHCAARHVYVSR